jgi:hypothetical protein
LASGERGNKGEIVAGPAIRQSAECCNSEQKGTEMKIRIPEEKSRETVPAGSHYGVGYTVCDLGVQNGPYGAKRQLYLRWELPGERTSKGEPFTIGKFYTLTANERGALRQDLESWFGRTLSGDDIAGLDLGEALLGRTAMLGVIHNAGQNGKLRANVSSVMLPPRGKPEKVSTANDPSIFGFDDDFDRRAYDALPEWLRTIVSRSPEYRRGTAPQSGTAKDRLDNGLNGGSTAPVDDLVDDEIPY